ncbi:MAG TPA: flavin reductase family protein [Gemmataceae bacterium]|nr:flavin reductase family protein [Gemmataceae bacterium]
MTESDRQLASALGRIASGLFIVTARRGTAETGMLASWVQQCSFDPPQITLAIQSDRPILTWLDTDAALTVNVLDDTQTDMIVHFGRGFALDQPAFEDLDIAHPDDGPAVLTEALAYLQCRVAQRINVGDHDLVLARVVGGQLLSNGQPMVHARKSGMHY